MNGLNFFLKVSAVTWLWIGVLWLLYEAVKTT